MYLTISTSTNAQSRSVRLAQAATDVLWELVSDVTTIDLADYDLPIDNGQSCHHDEVRDIRDQIGVAEGIILVVPIYHGDVSVATRNLIQLCGTSWQRKVVGLISVAGDAISHSAAVNFASSLMLEHRSFIIPDFVFVDSKNLAQGLPNGKVEEKLRKMVGNLVRVTESLKLAETRCGRPGPPRLAGKTLR